MRVLLVLTVVPTTYLTILERPNHSQACTVVPPCVAAVSQKFLGGEFLTDARSFGSAASHRNENDFMTLGGNGVSLRSSSRVRGAFIGADLPKNALRDYQPA